HYDSTDWGWNEKAARKEFGQPVPSELKKAQTSLKHAQESLDLEMTNYKVGRAQLAPLEPKVAEQQQDFARYFTYLENGPNPEVKGSAPIVRRLRFDKGFGLLPGVEWHGKVIAENSYDNYQAWLEEIENSSAKKLVLFGEYVLGKDIVVNG